MSKLQEDEEDDSLNQSLPPNIPCVNDPPSFIQQSLQPKRPRPARRDLKILVVGYNGCGKSTLVNQFTGMTLAESGVAFDPTKHDVVVIHRCVYNEEPIRIYDIRGFGDRWLPNNEKNIAAAMKKVEEVDVVLICHRLYDPVDERTEKLLNLLAVYLGDGLIERSIIVFTFGDEYETRIKDRQQPKDESVRQQQEQKYKIKEILKRTGAKNDIVDKIPTIITCGRPIAIPTSDDWVVDLWGLCNERCGDKSLRCQTWSQINPKKAVGGGVAGGGVVLAGIGGAIGLIGGPIGGIIGAGIGGAIGGLVGGGIGVKKASK